MFEVQDSKTPIQVNMSCLTIFNHSLITFWKVVIPKGTHQFKFLTLLNPILSSKTPKISPPKLLVLTCRWTDSYKKFLLKVAFNSSYFGCRWTDFSCRWTDFTWRWNDIFLIKMQVEKILNMINSQNLLIFSYRWTEIYLHCNVGWF